MFLFVWAIVLQEINPDVEPPMTKATGFLFQRAVASRNQRSYILSTGVLYRDPVPVRERHLPTACLPKVRLRLRAVSSDPH